MLDTGSSRRYPHNPKLENQDETEVQWPTVSFGQVKQIFGPSTVCTDAQVVNCSVYDDPLVRNKAPQRLRGSTTDTNDFLTILPRHTPSHSAPVQQQRRQPLELLLPPEQVPLLVDKPF